MIFPACLHKAWCDPWHQSVFLRNPKSPKGNKDHILFIFFSLSLDYVRTTISKCAILKVSGGKEDKNRKGDNSKTLNPQMLHEMCTKPCATTANPPKQGPIKDLGAPNWTHPMPPISSKIQVVRLILVSLSHS